MEPADNQIFEMNWDALLPFTESEPSTMPGHLKTFFAGRDRAIQLINGSGSVEEKRQALTDFFNSIVTDFTYAELQSERTLIIKTVDHILFNTSSQRDVKCIIYFLKMLFDRQILNPRQFVFRIVQIADLVDDNNSKQEVFRQYTQLFIKIAHDVLHQVNPDLKDEHNLYLACCYKFFFKYPVRLDIPNWETMDKLFKLGYDSSAHPEFIRNGARPFMGLALRPGFDVIAFVRAGFPIDFGDSPHYNHALIIAKAKECGCVPRSWPEAMLVIIKNIHEQNVPINPLNLHAHDPILAICHQFSPELMREWIDAYMSIAPNQLKVLDKEHETALTQRIKDSGSSPELIRCLAQDYQLLMTRNGKGESAIDCAVDFQNAQSTTKEEAQRRCLIVAHLNDLGGDWGGTFQFFNYVKWAMISRLYSDNEILQCINKLQLADLTVECLTEIFNFACIYNYPLVAGILSCKGAKLTQGIQKLFESKNWNMLKVIIDNLRARKVTPDIMFQILNVRDLQGNSFLTIGFIPADYLEDLLVEYPCLINLRSSIVTIKNVNGQVSREFFPEESILHYAIRMNHIPKCNWALKKNPDLKATLPDGTTLIQYALKFQRELFILEIYCSQIRNQGYSVSLVGSYAEDPILNLCVMFPQKLDESLKQYMGQVHEALFKELDQDGETVLTQRLKDPTTPLALLQALIKHFPHLTDMPNAQGQRPIECAALPIPEQETEEVARKKCEIISHLTKVVTLPTGEDFSINYFKWLMLTNNCSPELLLSVDFDRIASSVRSDLFVYACRTNHLEVADKLFQRGVDLTVKDKKGFTPFKWLMWNDKKEYFHSLLNHLREKKIPSKEMFDLLSINDRQGNSILTAAFFPAAFVEELLADYPQLINLKSSINSGGSLFAGETYLHYVIRIGDYNKFQWALEKKADTNALLPDNSTPIQQALRYKREECAVQLYQLNPKIFHMNEKGDTLRSLAFRYEMITHVSSLKQGGKLPLGKDKLVALFCGMCHPQMTPETIKRVITFALQFHLTEVSKKLAESIDAKVFVAHFTEALTPEMPMNYWLEHLVAVDEKHLTDKIEESDLPQADPAIDINQLVAALKAIANSPEGHLLDPIKQSREKMIRDLENYISSVVAQKPRAKLKNPQEFYPPVHNALRHVTLLLAKLQKEDQIQLLKELALGAALCETRWYNAPIELFNVYRLFAGDTHGQNNSLQNLVLAELMRLRVGIADDLIAGPNTHRRMRLRQLIGSEVNISGTTKGFEDNYNDNLGMTKEQALSEFRRYYFPSKLFFHLKKFLEERFKQELKLDLTSSVFEWYKENMPQNYKKREYTSAQARLKKFQSYGLEQKDLVRIGDNYGIDMRSKRKLEVSTEDARYQDFRDSKLFEEDLVHFKVESVFYVLNRMKILSEHKPGVLALVLAKIEEKTK